MKGRLKFLILDTFEKSEGMGRGYLGYKECKELLRRLILLLKGELGNELLAVALFGSVARGKAGKESDVDLLVVYEGERVRVEKIFLGTVLALREGEEYRTLKAKGYLPDVFPVFMNPSILKGHPWLLLDVMDHGIILLDRGGILKGELKKIKGRLKELGSRRVVLEDGTWYWDLKPDWRPGEVIEI